MYLHSIVWESNGQEVTGGTSVAVLHHAQAARFDLQQHVWCFNIKHLRQWQREHQSDPNLSGHKDARKSRRKKGDLVGPSFFFAPRCVLKNTHQNSISGCAYDALPISSPGAALDQNLLIVFCKPISHADRLPLVSRWCLKQLQWCQEQASGRRVRVSKITSARSGVRRASLLTVVSNCSHLDCTVVGGCGHKGVIGGETAVIYWLKVAKHGVLGWWLVEVPQLQTEHKEWVQKWWWFKMWKHMHNLNVHELVIGAGDQQEAPHRVGELAVVDLLFMLLLEDPQKPSSLHIPNLRCRESGACLYLAATGSFHWGGRGSYLHFSVAGAGCEQTVVRGESAAQHFVVVRLDLCQLLTCSAFKHLGTEQLHGNQSE